MRITASWLISDICVGSSSIVIRKTPYSATILFHLFIKHYFRWQKGSIYIKYYNFGQILVNQRRMLIEYELLRISGSIRTSPFRYMTVIFSLLGSTTILNLCLPFEV
jgi:hypothetical protein